MNKLTFVCIINKLKFIREGLGVVNCKYEGFCMHCFHGQVVMTVGSRSSSYRFKGKKVKPAVN